MPRVETALVHFSDMSDKLGLDTPRALQELRQAVEQLVIGYL
jgi:hypothetical protein